MSSDDQERVIEEREKRHDLNQAAQLATEDGASVELLKELVDSELHPGRTHVLDNYLSKDLLLSMQSGKELREFKLLFQIKVLRALWMHPHEESGMTGKTRAFHYDDPDDMLMPLDSRWRNILRNFADATFRGRIRRAEGGFQQEQLSKTHNVVERTSEDKSDDSSRLGGLF